MILMVITLSRVIFFIPILTFSGCSLFDNKEIFWQCDTYLSRSVYISGEPSEMDTIIVGEIYLAETTLFSVPELDGIAALGEAINQCREKYNGD